MTATCRPITQARRGRWLEMAINASGEIYKRRRMGCLLWHREQWVHTQVGGERRHVRVKGPVDFTGVYGGVGVAFDAKVTRDTRLRFEHVEAHQFELIETYTACTGIGFLLVSFERPDLGRSFACTGLWFKQTLARLDGRRSVPFDAFEAAAEHANSQCTEVVHGAGGVPLAWGPAALKLHLAANGQG